MPFAPVSTQRPVTHKDFHNGRQVQVTIRDTDETRLLERLTMLLAQYPVAPPSPDTSRDVRGSTGQPEGFCAIHQVPMRRNEKDGRSWYSHKAQDGSWCTGKLKGQGR